MSTNDQRPSTDDLLGVWAETGTMSRFDQAAARRVARGARQRWSDNYDNLSETQPSPGALAVTDARDWWADVHGWPCEQDAGYPEWIALVTAEAKALGAS